MPQTWKTDLGSEKARPEDDGLPGRPLGLITQEEIMGHPDVRMAVERASEYEKEVGMAARELRVRTARSLRRE